MGDKKGQTGEERGIKEDRTNSMERDNTKKTSKERETMTQRKRNG